jgi:hypothetical protein
MRFAYFLIAVSCAGQTTQAPAFREAELDRQNIEQLFAVRRVYVDRLNGGETAVELRDMIISSLERSKLFAITENPERADATLRGSAEDLVFTDTFASSDSINVHGNFGTSNGTSTSSKDHRGVYGGAGVGEQESLHTAERKHEATASVRLVTKDGDVIWSTTQESMGAKLHGASSDVANKIMRQLLADFVRARQLQRKQE